MKVQSETVRQMHKTILSESPKEIGAEIYRQVNSTSFLKNFNVLIGHYKNEPKFKSPAVAAR